MFNRAWADYSDDEELPTIPWLRVVEVKQKSEVVKSVNNKFWILDLEEESEEEDFCLGCETGADADCAHTCCN